MNNKLKKIIIIGQFPPPQHGSNVMAEITYNFILRLGYDVNFIDKKFSKKISEMGKITLNKLKRYPFLGIDILTSCFKNKPQLVFTF